MKYLFFLSIFFFLPGLPGNAQTTRREGSMYWIKYFNKIQFSKGWNFQTEIESRRFISPERSFHFVVPRIHLHKSFDKVDLGLGLAYFLLSTPSDPGLNVEVLVPEFRPHLDLGLAHNPMGIHLDHRYRLEGRFIHNNNGIILTDGYTFRFRLRYRLQTVVPLSKSKDNLISLILSDEILLNMGAGSNVPIFDHNRLQLGPRIRVSPSIKLDLVYMYWYQQLNNQRDYASYNIVSVTLHHTIDLSG